MVVSALCRVNFLYSVKRVNGSYSLLLGTQMLDEATLAALLEALGEP